MRHMMRILAAATAAAVASTTTIAASASSSSAASALGGRGELPPRPPAFVPIPSRAEALRRSSARSTAPAAYAAAAPAPVRAAELLSSLYVKEGSDVLRERRDKLKRRLLSAADEYRKARDAVDHDASEGREMDRDGDEDRKRYAVRLLGGIVRKILRRGKRGGDEEEVEGASSSGSANRRRMRSILGSDAFGTLTLEVGEWGNATVALAEQLSEFNPTPVPTYGWRGYGGGEPSDCKLDGRWKLRFTTAADATFPESPGRGKAVTSQEVDAEKGTLTNVVDFERGKLEGFRVVVSGEAVSDDRVDLTFRRVVIKRRSRFPRLFGTLVFPVPTRLLRAINRFFSKEKFNRDVPYFRLMYLDEDLRIHKTGEGNWFIQSRLA